MVLQSLDKILQKSKKKTKDKMQKKSRHNKKNKKTNNNNMELRKLEPITEKQEDVFYYYEKHKNILLYGSAGTGKTFISLYLSLKDQNIDKYKKIFIVRSTVPSRDQGFMPGTKDEKTRMYEMPYYSIFSELFGRGDAYECMKKTNKVMFESTSYMRGVTLDNCVIIMDEVQNMNFQEIDTILTRVGKNSRVLICGDYKQTDLNKNNDKSGFKELLKVTRKMKSFKEVEFTKDDIVRSGFVKEYIIAKEDTI